MSDDIRERVRAQYGDGIPVSGQFRAGGVTKSPEKREPIDDTRLEKDIVARADKQMRSLGFEVVSIGQVGSAKGTKQTPGIPDRRYYHRVRRLALWWEAKTPTGRQRPDQKYFEEMCTAVGEVYVLGTDDALFAWLVEQRIAFAAEGGILVSLPAQSSADSSASR